MRLAWTLGAILLLSHPAGASAAARARPAARSPASGTDLSASYSFLRSGEAHLHGADLSASFHFQRSWRLLADLSVHSGSFAGADLKQLNFMGGLRRLFGRGGRWQPFGQGMLGGSHSTSTLRALT